MMYEAIKRAGSPERATARAKRYVLFAQKAIDVQKLGKAYIFLQKAAKLVAELGILQAEYNKEARKLGKPTSPPEKCSNCKKQKLDVKRRIDPYQEDVKDKTVYRNFCDDCHKQVQGEI